MALLSVDGLRTRYVTRGRVLNAVDGVSLDVDLGETVGLVGESGCGKSTLGKTILRLLDPVEGSIRIRGNEISDLGQYALLPFRRRMQMVFQDPYGSLNPRQTVARLLTTPLKVHGVRGRAERRRRVRDIVSRVGLPVEALDRYPHEFSGGQRQRIGVARALILEPDLIVCDEPVSALDLSIQAQILNLLVDLKRDLGLSYLFISHDLSVVRVFRRSGAGRCILAVSSRAPAMRRSGANPGILTPARCLLQFLGLTRTGCAARLHCAAS